MIRLKRDLGRIHRILKHFDSRWQNLRPLLRIVEAFIAPLGTTEEVARTDSPDPRDTPGHGNASKPVPDISNYLAVNSSYQEAPSFDIDPTMGDFFFDFDSFELHPATMWAYRPSIPNSPR
jgi:hypothetical protein